MHVIYENSINMQPLLFDNSSSGPSCKQVFRLWTNAVYQHPRRQSRVKDHSQSMTYSSSGKLFERLTTIILLIITLFFLPSLIEEDGCFYLQLIALEF